MTKAERWHRISALFDRVVELPVAEREAVLAEACAEDPELRREVERLLAADQRTSPVDQDIAGQASLLLLEGDPHEHEGQQFGAYRIVRLLAQGGMGRVYLAEREGEDFAQTVALKLVGGAGHFDAYTARRRFLDERRILARLQHPNIARLLDGGVGPQAQPWFAMEYVDGAPLTDWCDTQRLSVRERLILFAKVCEAVDHAHRFLIVHRDLKPGNVLVDARGEPKVLDFGIAKLLDEGGPSERTGSTILMTPDYAAPEQMRGGQISTATDVYALGAVLFEVLTGRKPFVDPLAPREPPQASKIATEGQHTGERAQARATTPQALRKHLRGDLDRIVRTALDPEPSRRYRSAATLAQDLRAVANGQAISLRSDTAYRVGIFLRRHRWAVSAVAVAAVGLLGTTGWALWQGHQATQNASEAARQADEAAKQAGIARQESNTANNVKNLVANLLSSASPETSLGRTLTVKQVLDDSRTALPATVAEEPLVAAELLGVMARSYIALEEYDSAQTLLTTSAVRTAALDIPRTALLHTVDLELALATQDKSERATASHAALRKLLPALAQPERKLEALAALAAFEFAAGDKNFQSSLTALQKVREELPRSDPRRINTAALIADLRINSSLGLGDQSGTMTLMETALADADKYLPPLNPQAARLRKKLAVFYILQSKPAAAIALYRRVLEEDRRVFGADSNVTAQTLRYMSQAQQMLGNYAEFQTYAAEALKIFESRPTSDKSDLATAKEYLADAAFTRGDYEAAERNYRLAYEDHLASSAHSGMELFTRLKIARTLWLQGRKDDAARLYDEIASQARPDSAAQAVAWIGQGDIAHDAGDLDRAADSYRRAADQLQRRAMAPGASYYRFFALQQLAGVREEQRRTGEGQQLLEEVLASLDTRFPYNYPQLTRTYLLMGRMLATTDRAEAHRLLLRCVELREQIYGASHPFTREAKAALGTLKRG